MKTSQLRAIIREELLSELHEAENTEYGSMYDSPKQQQSEMNMLLKQAEELKQMRDDLTRQIEQLEIIANTFNVNEAGLFGLKNPDDAKKGYSSTIDPDDTTEKSADFLRKYKKLNEEEQLNEMPVYKVADKEGFKKTLEKYKSNPPSKNKALDIILTSLEKHGEVDTQELSKRAGKDSATFNNAEIRKFVARPEDEDFVTKQGEPLIDFTPFLEKERKERNKTEKPSAASKPEKTAASKAEKPAAEKKAEAPKAEKTAAPKVEKPAATKAKPADKEDTAALRAAAKVKGGALTKAEKYAKLNKEFNRIDTELRSLAKDTSPEAMTKRKALSADKIRIEQAMAKLKQI